MDENFWSKISRGRNALNVLTLIFQFTRVFELNKLIISISISREILAMVFDRRERQKTKKENVKENLLEATSAFEYDYTPIISRDSRGCKDSDQGCQPSKDYQNNLRVSQRKKERERCHTDQENIKNNFFFFLL